MAILVNVKESVEVKQGVHKGEITDVKMETRGDAGYTYVDVHVTVDDEKKSDGTPLTIKKGFPATISLKSGLGKVIQDFGCTKAELEKNTGKSIDVQKYLRKGAKVEYMTKNVKSEGGGQFAEIVEDTFKPV